MDPGSIEVSRSEGAIRAAVVGCGRRGLELARLLGEIDRTQLIGVYDADAAARERAGRDTGLPAFASLDALLRQTRPELLIVATPAPGRAGIVEQAVGAGVRAVFAEKPLALTLRDVDRMIAACEATGALLTVGHHWRLCPEFQAMKSALQAGAIGKIEAVRGIGYGNLLDQGWHLLDGIRWLFDGAKVEWAMAQGVRDPQLLARLTGSSTGVHPDEAHPAPVWMTCHLRLEGDLRAALETGPLCQRTGHVLGEWHERRITVIGQDGLAECRPGSYFRLVSTRGGTQQVEAGPESLVHASRSLLSELCKALRGGGPAPHPAQDARHTLEGLLLCGRSVRDGSLALAPLAASDDPFAGLDDVPRRPPVPSRRHSETPRFSVLIPLNDHHGFYRECLESWLRQQDFPRQDYEVLVLADGSEPDLEQEARRARVPGDLLLVERGANRSRMYDVGARAARGEFLLLTESHCVAEPEMLVELDRYLDAHAYDGACCRTIPVCYNTWARADAELFEDGFRLFRREEDWRKVNVHAFALRREAYLRVGGLQSEYGMFAEMLLAADLRDHGIRLGYASGAAVQHHYRVTLSAVIDYVNDVVQGEMLYRLWHPGPDRIGFSFLEMAPEEAANVELERLARRILWQDVKRDAWRRDFSSFELWKGLFLGTLRRGRLGQWSAACRLYWNALYCHVWSRDHRRLKQGYQRACSAAARCSRRRFLRSRPPAGPPVRVAFPLTARPEQDLLGFHPLEQFQGEAFRWTGRFAAVRLPLTPGTYDVVIETRNIRSEPGLVRWFFNRSQLPAESVTFEEGRFRLRLTPGHFSTNGPPALTLLCDPWDVPDARDLGLPIFHISCEPVRPGNVPTELAPTIPIPSQDASQPLKAAA